MSLKYYFIRNLIINSQWDTVTVLDIWVNLVLFVNMKMIKWISCITPF